MGTKQRLYPTEDQTKILLQHCFDAKRIYNLCVEQHEFALKYRQRCGNREKWPTYAERGRQLTELRAFTPWLAKGAQDAQSQELRVVEIAFRNWFKNPRHFKKPTYRLKNGKQSFGLSTNGFRIKRVSRKKVHLFVPKLKSPIELRLSVAWGVLASAKSVRVSIDKAGRWWASFPSPQPSLERIPTGAAVGIDRGVIVAVTTSVGRMSSPATLSSAQEARLKRLERQFSRAKRGSARRTKLRLKINQLHAKRTNRKTDWVEKLTTELVTANDVIVLEALDIKAMTAKAGAYKRKLNSGILSSVWGKFETRLTAKAGTCEVEIIKVNPAFTSQRCSRCGYTSKDNRDNQATFRCKSCAYEANADVNAACNILAKGIGKISLVTAPGHGVAGRAEANALAPVKGRDPEISESVKRQPPSFSNLALAGNPLP